MIKKNIHYVEVPDTCSLCEGTVKIRSILRRAVRLYGNKGYHTLYTSENVFCCYFESVNCELFRQISCAECEIDRLSYLISVCVGICLRARKKVK